MLPACRCCWRRAPAATADSDADQPSRTFTPTQTYTPSPTWTPSPTESASVLPEELPADEVDPEEIVRAWVDAYNEAALTGDTSRLAAIGAPDCRSCSSIVDAIDEVYAAGGSIETEGAPKVVRGIEELDESTADRVLIDLRIENSPGVTRHSKDSEPVEYGASEDLWLFDLRQTDQRWSVAEIGE